MKPQQRSSFIQTRSSLVAVGASLRRRIPTPSILRYLGTELDGPDIARDLSVSLSTVRSHTQHVYTKLGVNSRRAGIGTAAPLGDRLG